MTLKHMQSATGYNIMARNWRRAGLSCLQVADAMTQRLALDRFDPEMLGEEDRRKYQELSEFLEELPRQGVSQTPGC